MSKVPLSGILSSESNTLPPNHDARHAITQPARHFLDYIFCGVMESTTCQAKNTLLAIFLKVRIILDWIISVNYCSLILKDFVEIYPQIFSRKSAEILSGRGFGIAMRSVA